MKKVLSIALVLVMVLAIFAGCGAEEAAAPAGGKTIYVTGPTPDHGWTAQAGAYAEKKVEEINAAGKYKAVYMPASSGEEQVDLVQTIIANGDAAGVVFFALEDSAKAGQEALIAQKIPFISFDRIIEGPDKYAILNASGDNWQCGAGIAYWLQQKGMLPGDTMITLIGDNGTVCSRRQEGFEQFLKGEIEYYDEHTKTSYKTDKVWTQDEINALCADYKVVCNWSADGAYDYLEQKLADITAAAKANNGKLFIFSQDDEMTFGVLRLLEGNALDAATKADLLGENGAGKSTLMNVLTGVISMDKGDIEFDGKTYAQPTIRQMEDAGIAFVHQELSVINDLTVYENIFLNASFQPKGKFCDPGYDHSGELPDRGAYTLLLEACDPSEGRAEEVCKSEADAAD